MNVDGTFVEALLAGLLAGVVCVGGLRWGVKILFDLQSQPDLPAPVRKRRMVLAGVVLIGQLFVAFGLLFYGASTKQPIPLGGGLVVSIMVFALLGSKADGI